MRFNADLVDLPRYLDLFFGRNVIDPITENDLWKNGHDHHAMRIRYSYKWHRDRFRRILELAAPYLPGATVLDVGCGEGWYSQIMAELAREVVGVDSHRKALERARAEVAAAGLNNVRFYEGNWRDLSRFQDNTFDFTLFTEGIEHEKEPEPVIRQIRRVSWRALYTFPIDEKPGQGCEDHVSFYTEADIPRLFGDEVQHIERDEKSVYVLVIREKRRP